MASSSILLLKDLAEAFASLRHHIESIHEAPNTTLVMIRQLCELVENLFEKLGAQVRQNELSLRLAERERRKANISAHSKQNDSIKTETYNMEAESYELIPEFKRLTAIKDETLARIDGLKTETGEILLFSRD